MSKENPFAKQWAMFKHESAEHELEVLHEDGVYRLLRMAKPGTGIYHWDIITWPGHLCIDGDIGDGLVFSRCHDMIREFFSTHGTYSDGAPCISIGYWAEKLSRGAKSVKTYSEDKFLQHVKDDLRERRHEISAERRKELFEEAEYVADYEESAREWLRDTPEYEDRDTWEWDLTDWDWHFVISCYAIAHTNKTYLEEKK